MIHDEILQNQFFVQNLSDQKRILRTNFLSYKIINEFAKMLNYESYNLRNEYNNKLIYETNTTTNQFTWRIQQQIDLQDEYNNKSIYVTNTTTSWFTWQIQQQVLYRTNHCQYTFLAFFSFINRSSILIEKMIVNLMKLHAKHQKRIYTKNIIWWRQ